MKDCLHSYMKVGIVQPMAFPESPVLDSIRKIAEDGFFGAIEIGPVAPDIKDKVVKLLETSKLIVGFCGQIIIRNENLNPNSLNKEERELAVAKMKGAVDESYTLGVRRMAMLTGSDPGAEKREEAKKALIDSLLQICSYAKSKGNLGIALEIFDRDIDKKCLIGPTKEGAQVAAEVRKKCPNFGLMVDLSHVPLLDETPEQAVKAAGNYLVHVHIGNCVKKDKSHIVYGDKHPRFGIAGGENDVEEVKRFLKALMDIGYIGHGKQNVVAFEVKPLSGESPEAVMANAKRTLLEAWAKL